MDLFVPIFLQYFPFFYHPVMSLTLLTEQYYYSILNINIVINKFINKKRLCGIYYIEIYFWTSYVTVLFIF